MVSKITNVHLKDAIVQLKKALETNDNAEEKLVAFGAELKVSNLLIPGIDNGEELVYETLISEDDELTFLPLFSDEEEFYKYYAKDSEYKPIDNDFEIYAGISDEVDGIIIDPEGESFVVTGEMIQMAAEDFSISSDDIETRKLSEIKEVYDGISNESIVKFISDEANAEDYEGIMVELSNSSMINLVVSDESLDQYAKNGVISADDVDGFSLCVMEDEDKGRYAIMFTDKDAVSKAIEDDGLFYYAQLTKISSLFEFVLRNDMDGVIINPEGEEFFIPRSELLAQASGIDIVVEDASFRNSLDYAFIL